MFVLQISKDGNTHAAFNPSNKWKLAKHAPPENIHSRCSGIKLNMGNN